MYVIRLPDGNLRVPVGVIGPERAEKAAHGETGNVIGQAYVEIGPDDPDYQRLLEQSITEEELADRRRRWRADDDALRQEFEEFKAEQAKE
ncbi:hypothetical protein [Actinoallomurus iriomotensis]|uniref:Uncharacterized protein n=1 Tax=Actinoallomurus iriomotensis TaxID=478107 RepID=A0A9W6RQ25_9ACTN|nr:hypothetical protein [Actinoallomurus iriomotensis]GLY79906.1 hypothetical protein Airi01_081730 [Actinoallomurus iriomotensis]